jgi:hypothetical protein
LSTIDFDLPTRSFSLSSPLAWLNSSSRLYQAMLRMGEVPPFHKWGFLPVVGNNLLNPKTALAHEAFPRDSVRPSCSEVVNSPKTVFP